MDILVLGAAGLLGSNVVETASTRGWTVTGTYHSSRPSLDVPLSQLDIRSRDTFQSVLDEYNPDAVVNCAALTDVDRCEDAPAEAFAVNGRAPGDLAACCAQREVEFVHVSTDYVFDGKAAVPYVESASPNPIQVYGKSKLEGERAVREAYGDAVVVRLSFVWGQHQSTGDLTGFPAWLRDRLTAGETTPLFTDQHVTPSRAGAAAATILALLDSGCNDVFHLAARSCVTPYEFGSKLCSWIGADESLIEAGVQADVDRPAPRPQYTCLDVEKVEAELDRHQPTLDADLKAVASLL